VPKIRAFSELTNIFAKKFPDEKYYRHW